MVEMMPVHPIMSGCAHLTHKNFNVVVFSLLVHQTNVSSYPTKCNEFGRLIKKGKKCLHIRRQFCGHWSKVIITHTSLLNSVWHNHIVKDAQAYIQPPTLGFRATVDIRLTADPLKL